MKGLKGTENQGCTVFQFQTYMCVRCEIAFQVLKQQKRRVETAGVPLIKKKYYKKLSKRKVVFHDFIKLN